MLLSTDESFSTTLAVTQSPGTDVVFEIARQDGKTAVHFTHVGLSPAQECYDVCSGGWSSLIKGSLRALITTGKGNPA